MIVGGNGELSATKQRAAIDNMASQKWDFVGIQTFGIGTLTDPIKKMIDGGTPVIASNRGSMPELIDDGVTGFLVNNVDEAVNAISRVGEIDRAVCRAAVSERFTVDRMADRYLDLYRSVLG